MTGVPEPDKWLLMRDRDAAAPVRLFCFPYAGGGASVFHGWRAPAKGLFEIWPIQLPGRENRIREAPITRLEELIAALTRALLPRLAPPFAFFGHSLGALIGFELACSLRARHGIGPIHLFVSGRRAPHLPDPDAPVHTLPAPEFIRRLRDLNGTPADVLSNDEFMSLALPTLRADFALSETYRYMARDPLPSPISAFGGALDPEVPEWDLNEWRRHTQHRFVTRMLPGDHFFLHANRDALLAAIGRDLQADLEVGRSDLGYGPRETAFGP